MQEKRSDKKEALLLPEAILPRLTTKRMGRTIYHYDEIGSTNTEAKRLANDGCPDGTFVIAETQHGGKGRLTRSFYTPYAKGIWFTVVLRPTFAPTDAPKCTLMAALAVCRAIKRVVRIDCGIKWPNDILCGEKKLVGILTEMSADMDGIRHITIGMGINGNLTNEEFPQELKTIATSLLEESGRRIDRIELLATLAEELEAVYEIALTEGFASILAAWKEYSVMLGQNVRVIGIEEEYCGTAIDIDESGALLVKTEDGVRTVLAGDVSIRPR